MNIAKLLAEKPEVIEKMSDKELEAFFAPVLDVTRPDRAPKIETNQRKGSTRRGNMTSNQLAKLARAQQKARQLGMDLNF